MGHRLGVWIAALVCACLLAAGCAENALVTPNVSPTGPGVTSGAPDGSTGGDGSEAPSASASEPPASGAVDETAGRYPDGLPKVIDGQPVLRGDEAVAHAGATKDATPFLVAGWVTPSGPHTCPSAGCGDPTRFADEAGTVDAALDKQVEFRSLADGSALVAGPLVVRVHTHDPPPDCTGATCDRVMVTDAVVWAGDAQTDPRPLSLDATTSIITDTIKDTSFQAMGSPVIDCGYQLPASQLLVAVPPEDESGASAPRDWVANVNVAPSVEALGEALKTVAAPKTPAARAGVDNVFSRANLVCRATPGGVPRTFRWLIAGNVAMVLATPESPSLQDRVFIQGLATAFDNATHGSPGASESPGPSEGASPSPSAPATSRPTPRKTPKPPRKP